MMSPPKIPPLQELLAQPAYSPEALTERYQEELARLENLPRQEQHKLRRTWRTKGWRPGLAGIALALALGSSFLSPIPVRAANITVDAGGACTLAEAITTANDGSTQPGCTTGDGSGPDTITLETNVTLGAALPNITSEIVIEGNTYSIDGANNYQILNIAATGDLTINDTTVENGYAATKGGGIYNQGNLTINDSIISGNSAGDQGGGIYTKSGTVELSNSAISGNSAASEGGGLCVTNGDVTLNNGSTIKDHTSAYAIYIADGSLTFNDSIISGNTGKAAYIVGGTTTLNDSTVSGNGTGLYFNDGSGSINDSTITGNGTGVDVYLATSGEVTINNSTISGNTNRGLHVHHSGSGNNVALNNSTITGNTTGLYARNIDGDVTLNRSLISGNSSYEVQKVGSTGGNIIGDNYNVIGYGGSDGSSGFTPGDSDIVPAGALNTVLDSTLDDNGGPTQTHALVSGSPAIDAAPSGACVIAPLNQLDQRGYARLVDGDAAASTRECDSGAVEYGAAPAAFPAQEAQINGTDCALADAVAAANTDTAIGDCAAGTGDDTITLLKNSVVSGSSLPITSTLNIQGSGYLITGGYSQQIFAVDASGDLTINNTDLMGGYAASGGGLIQISGTVTVNDSTLTRGNTYTDGGAVHNAGSLTLNNSAVEDSYAGDDGGGIYNQGTLTIDDSTISGNSTGNISRQGGGLYIQSGTVELNTSIISGNSAPEGAGLYVRSGNVTLNSSTIKDHSTQYAIQMRDGALTFNSSTISGNGSGRVAYIVGGTATFNNSTISGNGSGPYFYDGIGVFNDSTITGNSKGLDVYRGTVTLNRTIISGNSNQEVDRVVAGYGSIIGGNYNVIGHSGNANSTNFTPSGSDIVPAGALTTVLTTTLADNGGETLTHALVSGSPAIDIITNDGTNNCYGSGYGSTSVDQRGGARAQGVNKGGSACDAGAFEYASSETPTAVTLSSFSARAGGPVILTAVGGLLATLASFGTAMWKRRRVSNQ